MRYLPNKLIESKKRHFWSGASAVTQRVLATASGAKRPPKDCTSFAPLLLTFVGVQAVKALRRCRAGRSTQRQDGG